MNDGIWPLVFQALVTFGQHNKVANIRAPIRYVFTFSLSSCLGRSLIITDCFLKASRKKKWALGRRRGEGVGLGQRSNWWGTGELGRRASSQVGGLRDRKVWGTSLCCRHVQKVCFWAHKGRKDNGGVEPGTEGLKAGLWDHRHCSHHPLPPLCPRCHLPPHCSNRVLSQGTRGHNKGLLLSATALCLMPGTWQPSE